MPFRFVHTADIHLDSPLRSLSLRNPDLAGLIGDSSRQALVAIVDLCLAEQVDALVIAGDLYDGEQTSMKTARFLAMQLGRLHAAGIAVYKIRGNHDALSKITQELVLPPSVKVFGGRAEVVVQRIGGLDIAIHGLSFSRPQAPETLLPKYKAPDAGAVNIGIMHTSLGGAPGHDPYAPTSIADLLASGFDYWALGHIHKRTSHGERQPIVMPGMPQGRDINEAGEKTVSLVTVADDRSLTVEERLTSIAQFERVTVDLTGATDWREGMERIERQLGLARAATRSPHLVARIELRGHTPLAWRLLADRDLLLNEAERRAEALGRTWIEKIEIKTESMSQDPQGSHADPVLELSALMRLEIAESSGTRAEVRRMVEDLRSDLPAEIRGLMGTDEAELDAFVALLLEEGSQDIVARLKHAGTGHP